MCMVCELHQQSIKEQQSKTFILQILFICFALLSQVQFPLNSKFEIHNITQLQFLQTDISHIFPK